MNFYRKSDNRTHVAQLVERRALIPKVAGSTPAVRVERTTMTIISPKRIERLWTACPELRPLHMAYSYGTLRWVISVNGMLHGATLISDDIAHALIRDRIVWWLADRYAQDNKRFFASRDGDFVQLGSNTTSETWAFVCRSDGGDPTLACILAAERVLGLPEWKE